MFAKAALYTAKQLQYSHTNNSTQMSLMKMKSTRRRGRPMQQMENCTL